MYNNHNESELEKLKQEYFAHKLTYKKVKNGKSRNNNTHL